MELAERPRPWIAKYHPVDKCCDESRRMADIVELHRIAGSAGRWCLIRLIDGSSDNVVYDTRTDVEIHKTHPAQIAIQVPPSGMRAAEAEEVLHYHRDIYDQLGKSPLEQPNLIQPLLHGDQRRQIQVLRRRR